MGVGVGVRNMAEKVGVAATRVTGQRGSGAPRHEKDESQKDSGSKSKQSPETGVNDVPGLDKSGAEGIRTPGLLIANETRYQLRHSPLHKRRLAGTTR